LYRTVPSRTKAGHDFHELQSREIRDLIFSVSDFNLFACGQDTTMIHKIAALAVVVMVTAAIESSRAWNLDPVSFVARILLCSKPFVMEFLHNSHPGTGVGRETALELAPGLRGDCQL
jgi:hypothetical protein